MRPKAPRAICLDILNQLEGADAHLDRLLTDSFKRYRHLISVDRAFLTELAYGVVRWRERLDWTIRHFSKIPFEKIEREILNALRLGLYQILFLSRTPIPAAVNESVELAKKIRGSGGAAFANAILHAILRQKEGRESPFPDMTQDPVLHVSVAYSHPIWTVSRWMNEMGIERTLKICEFNNRIPPLTLRTNTLKISRKTLIERLRGKGLEPFSTAYSEEGVGLKEPPPTSELPFLNEGFYAIQDEASQLVTLVLDPSPGERILDGCSAPGGKTTHMAQRMENSGEIYAMDLSREKVNRVEEGCRRVGIKIVKAMKGDATRPLPVPEGMKFDRVLADVPCSGFGTLRRNPDLKWKREPQDSVRLNELQSSILKNLSGFVKEGGILVYSTCTVFREEDEDVIEKFLGEHHEFRLDRIEKVLPEKCRSFAEEGYFKTYPPRDEMDGFFVARLKKDGGREMP